MRFFQKIVNFQFYKALDEFWLSLKAKLLILSQVSNALKLLQLLFLFEKLCQVLPHYFLALSTTLYSY
jgi:hypothetical protein